MLIGIQGAPLGPLADPAAVRVVARAAEQLGYSSLWVLDRRPGLDAVTLLASPAATTGRIRIGSGVLVAPEPGPARLAGALAGLDVVSAGRLDIALVGPASSRLDGMVDALDAHWHACHPVPRPRPPLLLAATGTAALEEVARRFDGWMPAGLPIESLSRGWADLRERAAGHGRDPADLRLVVRADVALAERALDARRRPYQGSLEQVVADVEATGAAGAHEVVLGVAAPDGVDQLLDTCARIAEAVG